MNASKNRFRLSTIVGLSTGLALCSVSWAQAPVFMRVNLNGSVGVQNPGPVGQWIPARGGQYDAHAGAYTGFLGFGPTEARHTPAQPAALANFFPTRHVDEPLFTIITPGQPAVRITRPGVRARPTPVGTPYVTAAKVFNGIQNTTGVANAALPLDLMTASAETRVGFSTRVRRGRTEQYIDARGTVGTTSPTFRVPFVSAQAGNLIRDPMHFQDVPLGSIVSGIFDLDPADFNVAITDASATAASYTEVGLNLPNLSDSIGRSMQDNPLAFKLSIAFDSSGQVGVDFQHNPMVSIVDPSSGSPISDPDTTITALILNSIIATQTADGWQYSLPQTGNPLELFQYQIATDSTLDNLFVDYGAASMIEVVPTPGAGALFATGLALIIRRRRRD